jgi:mannan endo-1,4-beta-mannosidase
MRTRPAVLLLLAVACTEPAKSAPKPAAWHGGWGIYQICWGRRFEPMLDEQLPKFAARPDYVMFYRDLGRPFPAGPIRVIRERGATPIVSLELWEWRNGRRGSYLAAINRGDWDDFFRRWGEEAEREGGRVLLRFGFEMNGDWFSWSGDPDAYVAAWRRARGLVRARNVEWVWAPNVASVPDTPRNGMHRYYPGDAFVDWVGVDGYNFGDDHDEWHAWESFESIFDALFEEFGQRYPGKPIMVAETASAPGPARGAWIREAHAYLARRPRVKALVWFHYDKRRENEPDWRIDASPESLRAFNETFARPRR